MKLLWEAVFGNSVCHDFDFEWEYDLENDVILNFRKEDTRSNSLSHSEKFLFDFWYCHYYGSGFNSNGVNLISLGPVARNRLKLLIENVDLLRCK